MLRDPDTGIIDRRLTGSVTQVSGFVFTPTHLWVGSTDKQLFRWPLASGTTPDATVVETSTIHDLTSTPDGRYLVAALDDGVMVHALPNGEPVARLVPFRDHSWATLYADGRYLAAAGDALSFRVENPTTRQVATLGGGFEPASIGSTSATRLASGHARVRATVFSPSGPPRVLLDDRWQLVSLLPSDGNLAAYDVDIVLDDSSARAHRLTVFPPEGAPVARDFAPPSVIRSAHALVIGNGNYRDPAAPKLPGALKDAADVTRVLQGAVTWHLSPDRVRHLVDLDAASLDREVRAFFEGASAGETLLFYFAGHGDRDDNEGFLLPIDHTPGTKERRFSSSALWRLIEGSKAERVVVILDACRSGSFAFPDTVGGRAETSKKPVAFLTATSAAASSADTAQGGPFTQALVRALGRVESIQASAGAVTVQSAFLYAAGEAADQRPRLTGTLDALPLAWPRDPNAKATTMAIAVKSPAAGSGIASISAAITSRQLFAQGAVKGKPGGPRTIELRVVPRYDAAWIRAAVYYLDEKKRAEIEVLAPSLDGPRFKAGKELLLALPVREGLTPGTYRVDVEPCGEGAKCGEETPASFNVEL